LVISFSETSLSNNSVAFSISLGVQRFIGC
jgi:hypothetical protein